MKRVLIFVLGVLTPALGAWAGEPAGTVFPSEPVLLKGLAEYKALSFEKNLQPDEGAQAPLDFEEKGKISTFKAVGLSVLLPGSGHWYLGNRNRARLFFGIEAAGWTSFAGFLWYSNQRENDYQNYAVAHAGADPAGKDEQFWRSLTFYENRDEYNKIGRVTNLANPFYPEIAFYNWQWDSPEAMQAYRDMRNSSKTAHRRAIFTLALLGVERLVAAADAYRLAKKINSKAASGELEVYFEPSASGGRLVLSRSF
ncbi:MAG: hypothetical protein L0Z48_02680 [candidate division Zixibacteria bacterium]|nr:hypothetical protein [candidate division Zixibacteria bacterium]MCI0595429.1 hypothetical protein [candidate division Zixibacteria bacterium]